MKTNGSLLILIGRRLSFFTRLGLRCLVVVCLLVPLAHAANTFSSTCALATARTANTATLLPNGKVLVAGGQAGGSPITSAELYDPATGTWSATGALATARYYHTASLLPNGRVLVVGGQGSTAPLTSAEVYDPATGVWTATGALATARTGHTATLLNSGKLLVVGGYSGINALPSAELYDPASGTWTASGTLAAARQNHTATLLPDGKVLVAAGYGTIVLTSAELYNPASGTWSVTGSLATARYLHTATLLPNGKILVAGGEGAGFLKSAETYDSATGLWSAAGTLGAGSTGRSRHTASLLPNGSVIIAGGFNFSAFASAFLYDSTAGTWSSTNPLVTGRYNHTATILADGRMLVAGGGGASAELYDSAVGAWTATGSLDPTRSDHTTTLLPNGKVLIAGGYHHDSFEHDLTSVKLYDPALGTWSDTGQLLAARSGHTATLLFNGKVLVAGGINSGGTLASVELYDPASGTWSATGNLSAARHRHTSTLLPSGQVLVVWGQFGVSGSGAGYVSSVEIYDPASGRWTTASTPSETGRIGHTATLLATGKVLIAGGFSTSVSGLCSLYDVSSGTWSPVASFPQRSYHTATLLPNGKVLVAGGAGDGAANVISKLYDPSNNTWNDTGSLATPRSAHTATLLLGGRVLVAGGNGVATAEVYDPATAAWSATGALIDGRNDHRATLLPSGKVLVTGDTGAGGSIAELYDVGLGYSPTWQPQVAAASFDATGKLMLAGTGFRGISSASGSNGSQDSSTNSPVVQLRQLNNEQSIFLSPEPSTLLSATGFTSEPVAPFSGYALATVFANGIPSAAAIVVFPTLVVEAPVGALISDGDALGFGTMLVGRPAVSVTFTITNPNLFDVTGLTITKDGANAADFTVTASPAIPVPPGGSSTFTVQFFSATSGTKTAAIHIANNVVGKNPYDINLTGQAYSFTQDTDSDGMNDASEYQMATLGFDWQVSQTAMVNTYHSSANGAGYFTPSQVQALNVGTPLLQRNPSTGVFTLTIGIEKSTDLSTFNPFPMTAPETFINGQGKLEFQFTVPDNTAFFQLRAQ